MKFNIDICKVLHIGNNNQYTKYIMNGSELSKVNHEKDLKVTISNYLKPKHCSDVAKKVNKLVGFTGRTFEHKSEKKIMPILLNALVRPHLKYYIKFWSPYYKKILINWSEYKEKLLKLFLNCETKLTKND